ncbi:putative PurR-regulated permease PerM [Clostridium saccharoperbutylacetonicum]|uniref:Uncharacterized protein n=1 Tax=Clostridium saccharoperbutylacetonicum N1-4(HMT) TaxID=931276 RepID=M1MQI7_9CLOT|nr:hypothetical protein [Clostridium saccharoperbutylacetonicum]AGF57011.1 hypothetical protein Cspa_c32500 [Clostridium saccharoperbutylacetonicum N1-4(HMT)]NRT62230.1 putative PurR-regulated permease PerM [Clostridium saccharoperbutylacetonicum]NSB25563.1 putative PurR-regulated permease PerM [Clostridium saccharoperbutylacetonicum]NSB44933.1 putative PurR-regulated permease PerM [Clostridium saccharoperbutylacetonicum]
MFKKIYIILFNFFKTSKRNELFEMIILPIIISIILYIFSKNLIIKIDDFVCDFNNTVISITALLVAFGVASLSILVTSSISIFSQTFVVMSIYYLFVEPKKKK